jgi:pimeloyl-ACP methyl ester carboxylesterase
MRKTHAIELLLTVAMSLSACGADDRGWELPPGGSGDGGGDDGGDDGGGDDGGGDDGGGDDGSGDDGGDDGGGDDGGDDGDPTSCTPLGTYAPEAGTHGVGSLTYGAGTTTLSGVNVALSGAVWYPAQSSGPEAPPADGAFPVVLIVHGYHGIFKIGNEQVWCGESFNNQARRVKTLQEIQQMYPGAEPALSFLGYRYLGEALASAGYIVVSIDANGTNCVPDSYGSDGFILEKSDLFEEHLGVLQASASNPSLSALDGHFDLEQVVYIGHSRGAEAAIHAAARDPVPGTTVVGLVAMAPPTYLFGNQQVDVDLAATSLVITPASDGDVFLGGGLKYYDAIAMRPGAPEGWFRAHQFPHGVGHNYFNSEWTEVWYSCETGSPRPDGDDGEGANRLSRAQVESYAADITLTYLAATIGGSHDARAVLAGNALLEDHQGVTTVAAYIESDDMIVIPSRPDEEGFANLAEYSFDEYGDAFNDTFRGWGTGHVGVWDGTTPQFWIEGVAATAATHVSLRVGQVVDDRNSGGEMVLDMELEDSSGNVVSAGSDWAGSTIAPYYPRGTCYPGQSYGGSAAKTALGTARIPVGCFEGDPGFSFDDIEVIRVVIPEPERGVLAFRDMQAQ